MCVTVAIALGSGVASAHEPTPAPDREAERRAMEALIDAVEDDPTLLQDGGGVLDVVAPDDGGDLHIDAIDGLENLAAEVAQIELDDHPDWECADEGGGPWDVLHAPDHETLRWCLQSEEGRWAMLATDDREHWCVTSLTPELVDSVHSPDECAVPDEDAW